jgi:CRISPR-associated protein Cas2
MPDYVVVYDVDTITPAGARRLRDVARVCEGGGLRVQYSVFELTVERHQFVSILAELGATMDQNLDSVRIYSISQAPVILGRRRRDETSRGGLAWIHRLTLGSAADHPWKRCLDLGEW